MNTSFTKELALIVVAIALGVAAMLGYQQFAATRVSPPPVVVKPVLPEPVTTAAKAVVAAVQQPESSGVPTARERELQRELDETRQRLLASQKAMSASVSAMAVASKPAPPAASKTPAPAALPDLGVRSAECQTLGVKFAGVPANPSWPSDGIAVWRLCTALLKEPLPAEARVSVADTSDALLTNGLRFVRLHDKDGGRELAFQVAKELRAAKSLLSPLQAAELDRFLSEAKGRQVKSQEPRSKGA